MRRNDASLVEVVLARFMSYAAPQKEASFSSSRYDTEGSLSSVNSEKLCLLTFLFALVFIALISPILCFGSLFSLFHLEGLWYFWMITLFDVGYLTWLLRLKKGKNYRKDICSDNQTNFTESTCKIHPFPYTDSVRYMGQ